MSWEFSPEVLAKARRYLDDDRVREVTGGWQVQGSAEHPYRVFTDADPVTHKATWISCTCRFGLEKGAGLSTCSHAAAVVIMIVSSPPPTPREEPPVSTVAERIGTQITQAWQRYLITGPETPAERTAQAKGRLLGLAQALATLRYGPELPTAAQVKSVAEEFRP